MLGRLQKEGVEPSPRHGVDRLIASCTVGLKDGRRIEPMDHSSRHGDGRFHHIVGQTNTLQRTNSSMRQRKIDGPPTGGAVLANIAAHFVDVCCEAGATEVVGHQGTAQSSTDDHEMGFFDFAHASCGT